MSTFSTGDIVQSKLGGPHMVVHELTKPLKLASIAGGQKDLLPCQWFDGNKFTFAFHHPSGLNLVKAYEAPEQPIAFTPGDLIRHTAGGPKLLVQPMSKPFQLFFSTQGTKGYVPCQWHDGKAFKSEGFHPSALEHIQEAQPDV